MKRSVLLVLVLLVGLVPSVGVAGNYFTVTSTGTNISITSKVTTQQTLPTAGVRLITSGYSYTNPGTDCTPASNGYCIFSATQNVAKNIGISGPQGTLEVEVCVRGDIAKLCQRYSVTVSPIPSNTMYITNGYGQGANTITKCTVASSGTLSSCIRTGTKLDNPYGLYINKKRTRAYITNSFLQHLTICNFSSTGTLENCGFTVFTFERGLGLLMDPSEQFLYVAQGGSDNIIRCAVSTSGVLYGCAPTGQSFAQALSGPISISLSNDASKAYITNYTGDTVSLCTRNSVTGDLSGCTTALSNVSGATGITFNSAGTHAYITNFDDDAVTVCTVQSNNLLSNCRTSGNGFSGPQGIKLNALGNKAFIINSKTNNVSVCQVHHSTGALSNCTTTGTNLNGPTGLFLIEN